MPIRDIPDLERRLRKLEMEADQRRHKIVVPERTVNTALPEREAEAINHGDLTGLDNDDHTQYLLRAELGVWQSFEPTVAPVSGAFSDMTREASYCKIGKIVFVRMAIMLTNNGTGSWGITFTLPSTPAAAFRDTFGGWSGVIVSGDISFPVIGVVNNAALKQVLFYKTDGSYPGVSGNFYLFNGFYREA